MVYCRIFDTGCFEHVSQNKRCAQESARRSNFLLPHRRIIMGHYIAHTLIWLKVDLSTLIYVGFVEVFLRPRCEDTLTTRAMMLGTFQTAESVGEQQNHQELYLSAGVGAHRAQDLNLEDIIVDNLYCFHFLCEVFRLRKKHNC